MLKEIEILKAETIIERNGYGYYFFKAYCSLTPNQRTNGFEYEKHFLN